MFRCHGSAGDDGKRSRFDEGLKVLDENFRTNLGQNCVKKRGVARERYISIQELGVSFKMVSSCW